MIFILKLDKIKLIISFYSRLFFNRIKLMEFISELDSLALGVASDSSAAEFSHHRPQNLNPCLPQPGGRGPARSAAAGAAVACHETMPA